MFCLIVVSSKETYVSFPVMEAPGLFSKICDVSSLHFDEINYFCMMLPHPTPEKVLVHFLTFYTGFVEHEILIAVFL